MLRFTSLSALFVSLVAAIGRADEPQQFRYQFKKGQELVFQQETETKQSQSLGGMDFSTTIKNSQIEAGKLQSVDDKGNFKFQTEIKRLNVEMNVARVGKYKFNSTDAEHEKGSVLGQALTPMYESLSGASITTVISPRGKIVGVEGLAELLQQSVKDNPLAAQFAGGGVTNDGAKVVRSEYYVEFPDKRLAVGDKWEIPMELELPKVGKVMGKSTYTFVGMEKLGNRVVAKITSTSDLSIDLNIEMDGAKVTGQLSSGANSGTAYFDPTLGQLVSRVGSIELSGSLKIEVGGNTIDLEQSQTVKTSTKLLDKLPQ